jgi:heat-inducible transcriptional repressor
MMLTDRQRLILHAVIDDYIRSAEPIGSRSISKREDVTFSPATIRNEMSDLEEMGYLEQPHTSAGRIPSIKGYRYYVDHLMKDDFAQAGDVTLLKQVMADRLQHSEKLVQQAASLLSQLTNYTSIVLGPEQQHTSLKRVQLVPIDDQHAVLLMVTSAGKVESRNVAIPPDFSIAEMERCIEIFNARLTGVPLLHLRAKLFTEVGSELAQYVDRYEELLKVIDEALDVESAQPKVITTGMTHMLDQPEFKDVAKVREILELFDHQEQLTQIVTTNSAGIQVRIGTENDHEAFKNCSLITANLSIAGESLGTIGIIGPTRMDYGRVIRLLDQLSSELISVNLRITDNSGGGDTSE